MTRLSLLMGLFLATTVTSIIILMAVMGKVTGSTLIYRGAVIFFIFGFLGTFFGSFLEIVFMPIVDEAESISLQKEMSGEDKELQADLGDLLEESKVSLIKQESGTPADESKPTAAAESGGLKVVS